MTAVTLEVKPESSAGPVEIGLGAGARAEILAFAVDEASKSVLAEYCESRQWPGCVCPQGIAGAAKYLADKPCASLLLVDLDDSQDPFVDLDALAEVCEPDTMVIAFGAKNDVSLYRELIEAGVSDYLIKPLTAELLDQAIAKAGEASEAESAVQSNGTLSIFIGARGGVGGSTTAVNTAWQIASRGEQRVMMVDLDLHFGTVALALDLEPGRGLREMLENPGRIDSMFVAGAAASVGQNLYVLASEEPLDSEPDITEDALIQLLDELRRAYGCVVVEMPRELIPRMRGVLTSASSVAVVTDLSLAGMRDTVRILEALRQNSPKVNRIVVANRVGGDKKHELPRNEFERGIEEKITHIVPEDSKAVKGALVAGKALGVAAKGSKVVAALDKLCDSVVVSSDDEAEENKSNGSSWKIWGKG